MASRLNRWIVVLSVVVAVVSVIATVKSERDKRLLASRVTESEGAISALDQERDRLQQELDNALLALDGQQIQLSGLKTQLDALQTLLADAEREVGRLHVEQALLIQSQQDLADQLAISNQERDEFKIKLSNLKDLKKAIRLTKHRIRQEKWQAWLARVRTQREQDLRQLAMGNRGYVVRHGASTLSVAPKVGAKLQVRVLEPQTE